MGRKLGGGDTTEENGSQRSLVETTLKDRSPEGSKPCTVSGELRSRATHEMLNLRIETKKRTAQPIG